MTAFLRAVPPSAGAARLVVLLAPVLALVLTSVDGPAPRLLLVLLVVVSSAAGARRPESPMLALALVLVVAWWGLASHDRLSVLVVPAAWLLLAAHLGAVLTSYGPRELPVSRDLLRRWTPRALGLAAAPPLLWLLTTGVDDTTAPAGLWLGGLLAALAVCVVGAVAVRARSAT